MGAHGTDVLAGLREPARDLRRLIPQVYEGFVHTHQAAMTPGALDTKTKELMALAIGVTQQCDGCIASHARGAARAGATVEEVAETLGVTILMNGGPATVYGPRALASFQDFLENLPRTAPAPTEG
ncbi:MAG: carboxymuconolactone decarboxylase family protein [Nocardioides sp.]